VIARFAKALANAFCLIPVIKFRDGFDGLANTAASMLYNGISHAAKAPIFRGIG
jgi:hypothetical protein